MKKTLGALFILVFSISITVLPVPITRAAEDEDTEDSDSIFQKASDVINGEYEVKTIPFKEIRVFQTMADGISKVKRDDIKPAI